MSTTQTETEAAYHEAHAEFLEVDASLPYGEPGDEDWDEAWEALEEARYELAVDLAARHGLDAQAVEDSIFRQYETRFEEGEAP